MRILVVMGSPRKGESYAVEKKIEERMKSLGEVEFDFLWLKDVHFGQCLGCHACIRFGEERCPLKDDRAQIEARMLAADGMIMVTPVYSLQVSYLMKIFIDHFSYLWHRPRFFGKFAMGIASGGGQFKETLGYLKQNATAWGFTWVTGLGAIHPDSLQPRMRAKLERQIDAAARHFYQAVQVGRTPAPGLGRLMWFRMWAINARAAKAYIPADFRHWTEQGWFEHDYYTGENIGLPRRLFARAMGNIIRLFLRSVYTGY